MREGETMRSCDQFSYLTSAEYPVGVIPIFANIMELILGLISGIRVLGPRPMQYDINPSGTTIGIAIK